MDMVTDVYERPTFGASPGSGNLSPGDTPSEFAEMLGESSSQDETPDKWITIFTAVTSACTCAGDPGRTRADAHGAEPRVEGASGTA